MSVEEIEKLVAREFHQIQEDVRYAITYRDKRIRELTAERDQAREHYACLEEKSQMDDEIIINLRAERDQYKSALEGLIYEITHLSPEEDDGSHRCRISKEALTNARKAVREA